MRGLPAAGSLDRVEGTDRLVVEVDHGSGAPSGFVEHAGERLPFHGYAEMVNEVERVRSGERPGEERGT